MGEKKNKNQNHRVLPSTGRQMLFRVLSRCVEVTGGSKGPGWAPGAAGVLVLSGTHQLRRAEICTLGTCPRNAPAWHSQANVGMRTLYTRVGLS